MSRFGGFRVSLSNPCSGPKICSSPAACARLAERQNGQTRIEGAKTPDAYRGFLPKYTANTHTHTHTHTHHKVFSQQPVTYMPLGARQSRAVPWPARGTVSLCLFSLGPEPWGAAETSFIGGQHITAQVRYARDPAHFGESDPCGPWLCTTDWPS